MEWLKSLFSTRSQRIFLDYASATPVRKEVREVMEKYWTKSFYNPSAIYQEGLEVKKEVEEYRSRVAKLLGVSHKDIVFTASGTESNNLAILGAYEAFKESQKGSRHPITKPHIIISAIEHPSVVRAAEEVVRRGGDMSIVPVNEEGLVSPEAIRLAVKHNTFLISVSMASSEIGTVEPIAKIGRIIREERKMGKTYPLLHTDASAAYLYLQVNLESLQADLVTLDSAKVYGPKGAGLLAVRRGVSLRPIVQGGGQERGLRSGTINPALIAGFSRAIELAASERMEESARTERLRGYFVDKITQEIPQAVINGSGDSRIPNIVSVSIPGVLSEFALLKLDQEGIMVSGGTTCSLDERESGSPVIRALGKPELAEATLRISFGKFTTDEDVEKATEIFCRTIKNMVK